MRMHVQSALTVSRAGIFLFVSSSPSNHTYSIHKISSMFGFTENKTEPKKNIEFLIRQKKF